MQQHPCPQLAALSASLSLANHTARHYLQVELRILYIAKPSSNEVPLRQSTVLMRADHLQASEETTWRLKTIKILPGSLLLLLEL